jgi:hypothetical protein
VALLNTNDNPEILDFNDFAKLNKFFPLLFYPAFKLQDVLRKKTLGVAAWRKKVRLLEWWRKKVRVG